MYEFVRNLFCPFEKIEKYIPEKGEILDVGCGHGIFARLIASKSLKRNITAIDPSSKKIAAARKLNHFKNINFQNKYLTDVVKKFDCVTVIDVLYLLPKKEKVKFLRSVKKVLKKNGVFILKEVNTSPKWMFTLSRWEEVLMIKLMGYTHSDFKKIEISTPKEIEVMLKLCEFKILEKESFYGKIGYPSHILFTTAQK